jgi:hypothetical protein
MHYICGQTPSMDVHALCGQTPSIGVHALCGQTPSMGVHALCGQTPSMDVLLAFTKEADTVLYTYYRSITWIQSRSMRVVADSEVSGGEGEGCFKST